MNTNLLRPCYGPLPSPPGLGFPLPAKSRGAQCSLPPWKYSDDTELDEQHRLFGGEVGEEESSLCYPMLMVVVGLFGGIDYEDP